MKSEDIWNKLRECKSHHDVAAVVSDIETSLSNVQWVPVGGSDRENNAGTIEITTDPGRALIERITNGVDAILEHEYVRHSGIPDCRSPREAASAWLGLGDNSLTLISDAERQRLANKLTITLEEGESKDNKSARVITVRDMGIGISPECLETTILSLNQGNKWTKHYLAGTYGQGGSSTFSSSKYTFIASRAEGTDIGFTLVKYQNLPAESYKTGNYVYLKVNGKLLTVSGEFERGTEVKHYGYDLSDYSSPLGANSLYGLLNQLLFDPVIPIWIDNKIHNYRRTIIGARNALNRQAIAAEENNDNSKVEYNVPLYHVSLDGYGQIGIEYWVLEAPQKKKNPVAGYVNPQKPIIYTTNGQNQEELTKTLIRKDAELPFLDNRLIVHVQCDRLTADSKRTFFVSNREGGRRGQLYNRIRDEIVQVLKTDDHLRQLNIEAKAKALENQDQQDEQQTRKEVASLLRLQGIPVSMGSFAKRSKESTADGIPRTSRPPKPPLEPIDPLDPPDWLQILPDNDESLTFYPGQRRYVRIVTNAPDSYHPAHDDASSRINFYLTHPSFSRAGSTPLKGGRMRIIIDLKEDIEHQDVEGSLVVEIQRQGLPPLRESKPLTMVEKPPAEESQQQLTLPEFKFVALDGPDNEDWQRLEWPDNTRLAAFEPELSEGQLIIYYSSVFPEFVQKLKKYEQHDNAKAQYFMARYRIWLAVYSLIKNEKEKDDHSADTADTSEHANRMSYCNTASLAALFAQRETDMALKEKKHEAEED